MSQSDANLNLRTTQTMQALLSRDEKKSKFFFIRRIPRRTMAREWERPPDDDYHRQLLEEGFVTAALLNRPFSDELTVDIRELDQHLLPHFWRVNQRAKFYQNRFYQFQWAFILSAFLTTALASLSVFLHAQGWTESSTGSFIGIIHWTEILGLLTAVISGIAAAVSFLDANQTPQKRWYKARAQAEALRSLYFLFLARQKPFDSLNERDRVQKMRHKVIEVLRQTRSGDSPPPAGTAPDHGTPAPDHEKHPGADRRDDEDTAPVVVPDAPQPAEPYNLLTEEEARLRAELYIQQRINYQDSYYQRRIAEFSFNSDKMLWVSAGLMGISTILSSYSVLSDRSVYAFITVLLPAFAAAVSAFRSLYQWQRQAAVYEDSWLALQQARLAMPDEDFLQPGDYARYFPSLVQRTEDVLRAEVSQWGQIEQGTSPDTPPPAPTEPVVPEPRGNRRRSNR
jgi:hypothetical protein